MITEWLVAVGTAIGGWFASLFPDFTVPDWLASAPATVNAALANLNGVSVWMDWPIVLGVTTFVVAIWGISFGIKVARAIASYLPFFGGAG